MSVHGPIGLLDDVAEMESYPELKVSFGTDPVSRSLKLGLNCERCRCCTNSRTEDGEYRIPGGIYYASAACHRMVSKHITC